MIEATIRDDKGDLGRITIDKLDEYDDDTADYSVKFAVDRCGAVGLHQRGIFRFPRTHTNALGLLLAALNTLTEKELTLEDGTEAGDLAGQERGTLPALPGKTERGGDHHRPSFWRR